MKVLLTLLMLFAVMPVHAAKDCPSTPFRQLGARCADLGLDSNRAVCRSGDRFAMYCDDKSRGYVRTCPSTRRCNEFAGRDDGRQPGKRGGSRGDDRRYDYRHPVPRGPHPDWYPGYRDDPWRGPWAERGPGYSLVPFRGDYYGCDVLRYDHFGRPMGFCHRGRRNVDCRGYCERY